MGTAKTQAGHNASLMSADPQEVMLGLNYLHMVTFTCHMLMIASSC